MEATWAEDLCGLTFELSRPWRRTPAGRGRTIFTQAWSGQTVAAVAGRRLERGVRRHCAARPVGHQEWTQRSRDLRDRLLASHEQ